MVKPRRKPRRKAVHIMVSAEVHDRLRALANRVDIPISLYVRQLIVKHLETEQERNRG